MYVLRIVFTIAYKSLILIAPCVVDCLMHEQIKPLTVKIYMLSLAKGESFHNIYCELHILEPGDHE